MTYEETAITKLLSFSYEKKDYSNAKKEWKYNGEVIEYQHPTEHCELCGHPVKYHYILHNTKNGAVLKVGSECVNNYTSLYIDGKKERARIKKDRQQKAMKLLRWHVYSVRHLVEDKAKENGLTMWGFNFDVKKDALHKELMADHNALTAIDLTPKIALKYIDALPALMEKYNYSKKGEINVEDIKRDLQ